MTLYEIRLSWERLINVSFFLSEYSPEAMSDDDGPDVSPERALLHAEVELLRQKLAKKIAEDRKELTPTHVDALVNVKLARAKSMLPTRWETEAKFHRVLKSAKSLEKDFEEVLAVLKSKIGKDPSAEIEARKARFFAKRWVEEASPDLNDAFSEANNWWYNEDEDDPLQESYSKVTAKIDHAVANLEYLIQSNEELKRAFAPSTANESGQAANTMVVQPPQHHLLMFDVKRHVDRYAGDHNDPAYLNQFCHWKSQWEAAYNVMKSMGGANETILFQKLKDTLVGTALSIANVYDGGGKDSLKRALQDLEEEYEDRIALAATYLTKATENKPDMASAAQSIYTAFNALENMRDIFEKQNVDVFHFSMINAFYNAMPAEMKADWDGFTMQDKVAYKARQKEARDNGKEELPVWTQGRVMNYDTFITWLKVFKARQPKSASESTSMEIAPTAANFAIQHGNPSPNLCFLCPGQAHHVTKCPKGVQMSFEEWKAACIQAKKCFKCGKDFVGNHLRACKVTCRFCKGLDERTDHHVLMCDRNDNRSFNSGVNPPEQENINPQEFRSKRPRGPRGPRGIDGREPLKPKAEKRPAGAVDNAKKMYQSLNDKIDNRFNTLMKMLGEPEAKRPKKKDKDDQE